MTVEPKGTTGLLHEWSLGMVAYMQPYPYLPSEGKGFDKFVGKRFPFSFTYKVQKIMPLLGE